MIRIFPKKRRRPWATKPTPTRAQLDALRTHHEHRVMVKKTHPDSIRNPTPLHRVPPYLSDEEEDY